MGIVCYVIDNITETNAISSFNLVLKDDARRWWDGVKSSMRSWAEVTRTLRKVYQPPQPN